MKNNFGTNISLTIFGESHGPYIGITLDGLPAGFPISLEKMKKDLDQRKAKNNLSTSRHEPDSFQIISGLYHGNTTGTPLTILIPNTNTNSKVYEDQKYLLRPGHADFTAFKKYHGFQDFRGGGHFSGRMTACIVAAGSICQQILDQKGISIVSHIEQLHTIYDTSFSSDPVQLAKQAQLLKEKDFAVIDSDKESEMKKAILQAKKEGDSVGGILETIITSIPAGIGEPFFDSVESILSHLLFSIPAVKGVSFGAGFELAKMKGSQANDPFVYNNSIQTKTNHNGGINGGITNGMPILIHTVIKPTPSIHKEQKSINYQTNEEISLQIQGRHDPCIVHRARIVVDSILAFGILDLFMSWKAEQICE